MFDPDRRKESLGIVLLYSRDVILTSSVGNIKSEPA